jgi:hypothetical protein
MEKCNDAGRLIFSSFLILSVGMAMAANFEISHPDFRIESSSENKVSIEVHFPELVVADTLVEGVSYQLVEMDGMGYLTVVGLPRLPQTTRLIGVGSSGSYKIATSVIRYKEYQDVTAFPAQPKLTRHDEENKFVIDQQFYKTDRWFPENICSPDDPSILREIRVLPVNICPFQYNPIRRTLRAVSSLNLTIEKTMDNGINPLTIHDQNLDHSFLPLYKSYILNFNEISANFDNDVEGFSNMLVITHDQFDPAVQPFAQWKNQKGVETTVVKTSEIGTNPTSYQIKNFIDNYYQAAVDKPDYLLLVGDVTGPYAIPWFSVAGSMSDHPYYQLIGNDILPDISGGRVSVQTVAEATTVFTKLVQYEQTPDMGNINWFHSSLVINSDDFQDPAAGAWAKSQFLGYGYNPVYHLGDNLGNASVSNVYSAINNGISYIFYIGHGSASSWGTTGFSSSNIPNLTNGAMQPVISSVACNNADLDVPYDVFAEVWLKNSVDKGSVGIMAFTESCSAYETDTLARGMLRALLSDTIPSFGNIIDYGRLHMFQSFGLGCSPAMYQSLLVGEPELQVWTNTPENLLITIPASAFFNSPIPIQVSDLNGPVEGALVCYWDSLGNYQRLYTDQSGSVSLNPGISSPVSGKITISGKNYVPVQSTIEIIPPNGPYVLVRDLIPIDTLSNHNQIIEAGEHFFFELFLENIGIDPADNIIVGVSSTDTNFTIMKDTSNLGSLSPAGTMTGGSFEAEVNSSCPHLHMIPIELEISASGGHLWQQSYWMLVRKGASIRIAVDTLYFPDTYLNFTSEIEVEVENEGPDTLWVQDLLPDIPQITVTPGNLIITPGNSLPVTVSFTPDSVNMYTGRIIMNNSDPINFQTLLMIEGAGIFAPDIEVEDSLRVYAAANDSLVEQLRLSNVGSGELQFSAQVIGYRPGSNVLDGAGGADTYGHIWVDSDEPSGPIFGWLDISSSGKALPLTGNNAISNPVPLGFKFSFYGVSYQSLRICSNGWLSFSTFSVAYNNLALPDPLAPRNLIAPLWDDLMMTSNSQVYTEDLGNKFVVMFSDMVRITGEGPYSFEVILYDNGNIILQYLNLNQPLPEYTVGIQNNDGSDGLTIAHNESYLKDSLAVLISRHSWLSVKPTGGTIASNDFLDLQITVRTSDFPFGEFYAAIQIESNDPNERLVVVPVHLTVGVTGMEAFRLNNLPSTIQLTPNFPNPFNPSTTIGYALPADMMVELVVYNLLGQRLKTLTSGIQRAGYHSVKWDGTNEYGSSMASGVYIYRLKMDEDNLIRKMILMR